MITLLSVTCGTYLIEMASNVRTLMVLIFPSGIPLVFPCFCGLSDILGKSPRSRGLAIQIFCHSALNSIPGLLVHCEN